MMNDAENPLTNFKQTGENNETMSPSMIRAQRAIIGVIGVVFGLLTMAPNVMLNGYHHLAGEIGVTASISFIAGGISSSLEVIEVQHGLNFYLSNFENEF